MTTEIAILDRNLDVKNSVIFLKVLGLHFNNHKESEEHRYGSGFNKLRTEMKDGGKNDGWYAFREPIHKIEPDGEKICYGNRINFPPCEFELNPRSSFPEAYKNSQNEEQSIGEVLLSTAWKRGLSPRVIKLDTKSKKIYIQFEYINSLIRAIVKREPTLEALDLTVAADAFGKLKTIPPINTQEMNQGKGQQIEDLIKKLSQDFSRGKKQLKFLIHEQIKSQFVRIEITSSLLSEILNALKICAGIVWDWVDENTIYLMPGEDYGRTYNLYSQSLLYSTNSDDLKFIETGGILDVFRQPIDELKFWWITQYFIYGGWPEIIKQFFHANGPRLIFYGQELSARGIETVPDIFDKLKIKMLGELIIQTAWSRFLTFRPIYLHSNTVAIRFIPKIEHVSLWIAETPSIDALEKSLIPPIPEKKFKIDTTLDNNKTGSPLDEIKVRISENAYFGAILIKYDDNDLGSIPLKIKLETWSIVELLDTICFHLDAMWDWIGDNKVYIVRNPNLSNS